MVATRRQEQVENASSTVDVRRSGRDRKPVETLISMSEQTKKTTTNQSSVRGNKGAKVSQFKGWTQIRKEQEKHVQNEKRRKTIPNTLTDPYTGETVWIDTATLQDIAIANKKNKPPWLLYKRYLIMVPSIQQRQIVYDRAAAAIAELEERILPSYGGRLQWKCIVTLKENTATSTTVATKAATKSKKPNDTTNKKSPYFCWNASGQLELAAWPYMIEKIPNPPHFPGYYKNGKVNARSKSTSSSNTTVCNNKSHAHNSNAAKNKHLPAPQRPNSENVETLLVATPQNDSVSLSTADTIHTYADAVLVVDSQCKQMIPGIPSDGVDVHHPTISQAALSIGNDDPNITNDVVIPLSDDNVNENEVEEEEEDVEEEDEDLSEDIKQLRELQERVITGLAELAFQERWRVSIPTITYKWISPLQQTFYTRKSAWDHAIELCKNDVLLDKVLHGYGANGKMILPKLPTQSATFNAGKLGFIRDGLWIIGQEEQWIHERLNATRTDEGKNDAFDPKSGGMQQHPNDIKIPTNHVVDNSSGVTKQPQRSWTGLSLFLHKTRAQRRDDLVKEILGGYNVHVVTPSTLIANSDTESSSSSLSIHAIESASPIPDNSVTQTTSGLLQTPPLKGNQDKSDPKYTLVDATKDLRNIWKSMTDDEKLKWNTDAGNQNELESSESILSSSPLTKALVPTKLPSINRKAPSNFDRSKKWSLNEQQIQMCYDAGMEHYDQIMRTVTARDLFRELQDGFDLLRERGRGRWDMNLPEFDTCSYAFLNDIKKSPWMPIVREILGNEVVLIHKGIFLSMPGSSKQVYHQDGPHLTTQYQKPCHAINVFVPLVDLTLDNGPTEFCLGSHILGYDELDEGYVTTPTVSAGTPIIFDYRLGHRGLGNSSTTCRPIVYCTYAASMDGKEFRDSANFSRKRYHRIGELVEKGLTRAERADKRQRT